MTKNMFCAGSLQTNQVQLLDLVGVVMALINRGTNEPELTHGLGISRKKFS